MKSWWKRNSDLVSYFVIFLLALLPVFYTWGRLKIGGDTMIPFDTEPLKKYLYQWLAVQNGGYYVQNYLPLYFVYSVASSLHLSIYQVSSLLYFLINFFAALGVYQITKLLSPKLESIPIRFLPVCFYLFSPALLNGWQYLYFYGILPWYLYFILKIILKNKVSYSDLIWLQVVIFFGSLDLPNPKYLFYLMVVPTTVLLVARYIDAFKFSQIRHLLSKVLLFVGMSLYLLLPLGYFVLHYRSEDYGIHVRNGYIDTGAMMDSGISTAGQMVTLHHGADLNDPVQVDYLKNPLVSLASYIVIFIFLYGIFAPKRNSRFVKPKLYLSVLTLVFLFLAIGPNPPFGFIYEFLVTKISLFAFLRTTAGAVFFLSLFYSLYLYLYLLETGSNRWRFVLGSYLMIFVIGYPIIFGHHYKNYSVRNKSVNGLERGFVLPDNYLQVADQLNHRLLDQKTYYPDADSSYLHTDWGYFGPPLYYFLYDNYPIFKDKIYSGLSNHNVGLIFTDGSIATVSAFANDPSNIKIVESGKIKVVAVDKKTFTPHFQIKSSSKTSKPTLEYSKIDPTKYRLILHNVSGDFQIIFSELFNQGWKVYSGSTLSMASKHFPDNWMNQYKILETNELDQATSIELDRFINTGLISTLGNGKPKNKVHYQWVNGLKSFSYLEDYSIDFVSKNFNGTIQNNNLPKGTFYETWNKSEISGLNHLEINNYANSWQGDASNICIDSNACLKNSDGTLDIELIIEFWPQKLFYLSVIISVFTFFICLILWLIDRLRNKSV